MIKIKGRNKAISIIMHFHILSHALSCIFHQIKICMAPELLQRSKNVCSLSMPQTAYFKNYYTFFKKCSLFFQWWFCWTWLDKSWEILTSEQFEQGLKKVEAVFVFTCKMLAKWAQWKHTSIKTISGYWRWKIILLKICANYII